MLRGQVIAIILGAVFLFVGLAACGIAAMRGRGGIRLLIWFGILNAMYGVRILAQVPALLIGLQLSSSVGDFAVAVIDYLIIIPGLLFWLELSRESCADSCRLPP